MSSYSQDAKRPYLYYENDIETDGLQCTVNRREHFAMLIRNSPLSSVYVFAQQGISKHMALWNAEALFDSNNNLQTLDRKILENVSEYKVADLNNDPLGGLRNKAIQLYKS